MKQAPLCKIFDKYRNLEPYFDPSSTGFIQGISIMRLNIVVAHRADLFTPGKVEETLAKIKDSWFQ
jgi:hypothetical protein